MRGSVNVNEPYYDEEEDAPAKHAAEALEESDSDEFVLEQPALTSADPHRTLEGTGAVMIPAPPRKSIANRVREFSKQATQAGETPRATAQQDLGPCLYFGPAGQRCDRRATAGGFCARHQPKDAAALGETRAVSIPQISKRALGAAGILAVLWPILFDLIREILRFLR